MVSVHISNEITQHYDPETGQYYFKKKKTFLNRQVEALKPLMKNIWTYIFLFFYFGVLIFLYTDGSLSEILFEWYRSAISAALFFLIAGAIPIVITAWLMDKKSYELPKISNGIILAIMGFLCVI